MNVRKILPVILAAVLVLAGCQNPETGAAASEEPAGRTASPAWVAKLPEAEKASQLFVVAGVGPTTAYISMHEKTADGWQEIMSTPGFIGKNGLGKEKEGDGKTPVGTFRFTEAFGIAEDPGCAIDYHQVTEDDYWSGDVREGYHYNQLVSLKEYPDLNLDDSEHLADYAYEYQYGLNISYNEAGTPGLGSAIFLHCFGAMKPQTGGCVAIPEDKMLTVMKRVKKDCTVVIAPLETIDPELAEKWKPAVKTGGLEAVVQRGTLLVGTTGDYNPMSYLDPASGEYVGFDAALAEDLAAALGVKLEYVPTSWPTLMEDTLAGKFDLAVCGITVTDARKEQALMSDGYLANGKTILVRREDADGYRSLEDLNRPEVRVMVNPGGLNEKFAKENLPDATLIIHDVNQDIPAKIAEGEADVMITEIMEAAYYVGQDSRLAAPLIYQPFTSGQLGFLMPRGSEDLLAYVNLFLHAQVISGRMDELADRYIYYYIDQAE